VPLTEAYQRGSRARPYSLAELEAALARPPHWPSAVSVQITDDGHVWLAVGSHPSQTDQRWVVIAPDGTPAYSVNLPVGFRLYTVRGGRVWGVGTDEFDVPYVQRFGVRGGS